MNEKKYKTLIILMSALLIVSVCLFMLQNFVLNKPATGVVIDVPGNTETVTIYRAINDIQPFTPLTPTMFEAVTIPKISDIGFITDISKINGSFARGYLFKGNYLTDNVITPSDFEAGLSYSIEIKPVFSGNIAYGDIVDVYAIKDETVTPVLQGKKLYQQQGQTSGAITKLYVKVTRDEMLMYFSMMETYKIAVVPIDAKQVAPSDRTAE